MAQQHNNKNRNDNNFFTQNIQRYGENFMDFINARDIQFGAINLFRGIARGRVNIEKYSTYFLNTQFLDPCIEAAASKYLLFSTSYAGVNCLVQQVTASGQTITADVISVLDYHKKCTEAYLIILNVLNNIKVTGDVSNLYVLANNLSPYRNNI